ncbi:MAG: glutamine synthetase [Parasphingorhabdus sp.]|jgi:glutamine synthetase
MSKAAERASASVEEAEQNLRASAVRFIRFELPDLMGLSRSKTIPIDSFAGFAKSGLNMYGGVLGLDSGSYVVPGTGMGDEVGFKDAKITPELSTLCVLPWEPETASVICSPRDADTHVLMPYSSRNVYLDLLRRASKQGFGVRTGIELEFYLLDAQTKLPVTGGQHIFATASNHWGEFMNDLLDNLNGLGLRLITHNAEYGPGQFEINFAPSDGIKAADEAFRFKTTVKELARRAGYIATFMSKPYIDRAGSGCHVHMGLRNLSGDSNAFVDLAGRDQLSKVAQSFTAGLVRHGAAMTALIAPSVNCYHRYLKGSFAPTRAGWGIEDRTALVRMKATGDDATHLEMRGGSGLSNPYLSAAATLAAGLIGIEAEYNLSPDSDMLAEDNEQFELLPGSLEIAVDKLLADSKLCEMIGMPFAELFVVVKKYELERWRSQISEWETTEYLELY